LANTVNRNQKVYTKPTVSNELLYVLAMFSEKNGMDFKKICKTASPTPSALTNNDERIAAEQFLQIWNQAEQASGDDNFGMHFGKDLAASYLSGNILANMMANCATIGAALQIFCKYHLLMEDAILPKMAIEHDSVSISWELFVPGLKMPRQHAESVLCALTEILRVVSGNQINPMQVRFSHPSPNDICEHQAIFKARLLFDQPETALEIYRTDFDRPIFLASRELFDVLEPLAHKRLHQMVFPGSWSQKVSHEIYLLLSSGTVPDVETVSSNLALSSRSLQMKLQKEEITFKQLFDQLRKETAMAYLKDPEISICEIALLLGFSEQSAFNHAFKRWTGKSPGRFKKKKVSLS
jgi:AraC-like DNA-binding protein